MSWKQYGGIKNLDSYNNISVNNIIADKFTVRDKFLTEFQIIGETQLLGSVTLGFNSSNLIQLKSDLISNSDIFIEGDVKVKGKLIITSSGEGFFFKGTDDGRLGINTEDPLAVLDIVGSYESVLNVYSDQSNNRNIIARNYLQNGIAVNVKDDDSSSIQFYSGTDVSNNKNTPDSEIKYLNGGILEIITGHDTRILSQVSISTDGSKGHIHNETMVVYDISNGTYKNLYYKDDTISQGNAFSLISQNSSSITSMNITTPDGVGAVISGGAYPIDNSRSMLVLDVSNNSDEKTQAIMIVSGQNKEKYNNTISINKYISQVDQYSLDVNGATYISDSQINIQEERNMRFLKVFTHGEHSLASGSYDTDARQLDVYESINGGVSWTTIPGLNIANSDNFSKNTSAIVKDIFTNNRVRCIIIQTSSDNSVSTGFFVSTNAIPNNGGEFGAYITRSIGVNSINDGIVCSSIYSFFESQNNHFITSREDKLDIFTLDSIGNPSIPKSIGFITNDVKGHGNIIYAVGYGGNIKSFTVNSSVNLRNYITPNNIFIERENASYNIHTNKDYKKVFVYDSNNIIAIGDGIITYTNNGGLTWNSETTIVNNISLNGVHIKSETEAIVVGNNGKIYISHDRYKTWTQINNDYINGAGTGEYLIAETSNDITSITMTNNNNILTTHTLTTTPDTGRLLLTYAPSLLNRDNSSTLDVIGSLNLYGDLIIHDRGELITTDVSFGLLKRNTKQIDFGLSGELITIGASTGLVNMNGRLQVTDDVSFNSKLYVLGATALDSTLDVTGATTLESTLDVFGATTLSSTLDVSGATNLNSTLDVSEATTLSSILDVSGATTLSSILDVSGATTLNSTLAVLRATNLNSTLDVSGATNLNSILYVFGGTTLNSILDVSGATTLNSTLDVSGATTLNSTLEVSEATTLDSTLDISGATSLNSTLDVSGATNLNSTLDVSEATTLSSILDVSGATNLKSTLGVTGATNLNSTLGVTGATTLDSTLDVSGATSLNSTLGVSGATNLNSTLDVSEATTLNSTLDVFGATNLNSILDVSGATNLNFTLDVSEATNLNSTLGVSGATTLNSILDVSGATNLDSTLGVSGVTNLKSTLGVTGATNLNSTLHVSGATILNSTLSVIGATGLSSGLTGTTADFSGALTAGTTTLQGFLNVNNSAHVRQELTVDNSLNVTELFGINSDTIHMNKSTGLVNMKGRLQVADDASFNSKVHISDDAILYSNLDVGGNAIITGSLTVDGDLNFRGIVSQTDISHNVLISDQLKVHNISDNEVALIVQQDTAVSSIVEFKRGNTTKVEIMNNGDILTNGVVKIMNNTTSNSNPDGTAGALYVKGGTRLDGPLNVMGDTHFEGDIIFIGAVTSLSVVENAILSITSDNINNNRFTYNGIPLDSDKTSKFNVNGGANFNDSVSISNTLYGANVEITGDVSFNSNTFIGSNLYLNGDASLNSDLFVNGVTTLGIANNIGIPLYVDGSGAMRIPVGATNQRPAQPEIGYIRYNTDDITFEGWGASNSWGSLGGVSNPLRTTQVYVDDNDDIVFKTDDKIRQTITKTTGDISLNTNFILGGNAYLKSNLFIDGDISGNSNLYLHGDASLNSNLFVSNNISVNSNLYVTSDASLNSNLFVANDISGNNNLYIGGDALLKSKLFVNNDISGNNNLYIGGDASLNSKLFVMGDISGNNKLYIGGDTLLKSKLFVNNDISGNNNLYLQGDASLNSKLYVSNDIYANSNLYVTGDASLNSNLFVAKDISANSNLYLAGDASLNSNLFVKNDISGNNNLYISGDALFNSKLIVNDDISGNNKLYIGGDVSLNSNLFINNDISGNNNIYIGGDASLNSNLFVKNDISGNNNLYISGDVLLKSKLFVDNDISGNNNIYIGGDASLNSNLFVKNDISGNNNLYISGDVSLNSNLFVNGIISGNSKLYLVDDASFNKNIIVNNDISGNNNIYIGGDASLNSNLFVKNDISCNNNLYVGGDGSFNSNLFIKNDIYGNSKLYIGGDASLNNNLYLRGDASLNKHLFVSGQTKLGIDISGGIPLYVDGYGAMRIPVGSTANRPTNFETGQIRFNTTDDTFEGYSSSNWGSLGGVSNPDKSSRVYIDASDSIVFQTNNLTRETVDTNGKVTFHVSNTQGNGIVDIKQTDTATLLRVRDSSNNNDIVIQNQGAFKLMYNQSGKESNRIELMNNEIAFKPINSTNSMIVNENGALIGHTNTLLNGLRGLDWKQIGNISNNNGTNLGNTVSISRNGTRIAFGEFSVNSIDASSNVHIYNVFEREISRLDILKITGGNVSSIDLNEDGSRIVIGKYNASPNGELELWKYDGIDSIYKQIGVLQSGTNANSQLGHTTSINNDGTIFAAGQYTTNEGTNGAIEGGVLIFESNTSSSIQKIADISLNYANATHTQMGRSIELNGVGDRIVIGGTIDESTSTSVYRLYVYQKQSNNSWSKKLDIINTSGVGVNFGISVAMSNDGKVISVATQEDLNSVEYGQVLVYDLSGNGTDGNDIEATLRGSPITLDGIDDGDILGASMSLNDDGTVLAIGSGSLNAFNGKVFIYKFMNEEWILIKDFNGATGSNLGGIHDHDIESGRLVSDEDCICVDGTGELVIIGAPNLFTADNVEGSGNGRIILHRNQIYTLGVNKKIRVNGNIIVDGTLDVVSTTQNRLFSSNTGIGNLIKSTGASSRNVLEGGSNYIYSESSTGEIGGHNRLYATQTNGYNMINATGNGGFNIIDAKTSNTIKINNTEKIRTTSSETILTNAINRIMGALSVTGATTLSNTLDVSGATTLSSTLGVSGVTTLTTIYGSNATLSGTLNVDGVTTLSNTTITGALTSASANITGALTGQTITAINNAIANISSDDSKLDKAGGTMTGDLILLGAGSNDTANQIIFRENFSGDDPNNESFFIGADLGGAGLDAQSLEFGFYNSPSARGSITDSLLSLKANGSAVLKGSLSTSGQLIANELVTNAFVNSTTNTVRLKPSFISKDSWFQFQNSTTTDSTNNTFDFAIEDTFNRISTRVNRDLVLRSGDNGAGNVIIQGSSNISGGRFEITKPQISVANIEPYIRLMPQGTQVDNTGLTNIFMSTSLSPNFGISLNAWRFRGDGVPKFVIKTHNASSAGVDRLTIDNDGNVGIGTTNPTAKLDVNGSANITGSLAVTGLARFIENGANLRIEGVDHVYFQWFVGGTRRAYMGFPNANSQVLKIVNEFTNSVVQILPALYTGSATLTGALSGTTANFSTSVTSPFIQGVGINDYHKIRLWSDTTTNSIGIHPNSTYGALSGPVMTFTVVNNNSRGWLFRDDGHTLTTQGAMSLTTSGILTVADRIRVGYGESDTGTSTEALNVNGTSTLNGIVNIKEATGTTAGVNRGSLIIEHNNNYGTSSIVFPSRFNNSSDYGFIEYKDSLSGTSGENAKLVIGIANDPDDDIILLPSGDVGIGTFDPTAKLDVNGTCKATTFNASSDIRVKTNIELVEPNKALEQINKLVPKTYKFYDSVETHYGLIAQETEQTIPEAVNSKGIQFIPSIFEECKLINNGKTIVLDTKTTSELLATKLEYNDLSGNKVSVQIESFEGEKYIHLQTSIEQHAKKTSNGLTVFVNGHEVNDFRSINYNTIIVAHIAATKELNTQLKDTQSQLKNLQAQFDELRNIVNILLQK